MLELLDISKRFGRRTPPVLHRVQFQAAAGAITVVQGRSGGGKTTLLRIIAGLEPATGGRVRLDGVDLGRTSPEDRDVALAFQSLVVYPHLDVAGNVRMAAEAGGRRGAARAEAVDAALVATELTGLAGRRPGAMSGGQLQRLALARMLARRPRMCLLDEPLAHLDPPARLALREIMAGLRDEERIVLLVTHDAGEAMRLADHLVVLAADDDHADGGGATVAAAGPPEDLARRPPTRAVADATGLDPVNLLPVAAAPASPPPPGGASHLGVRPEAVVARATGADPHADGLRARVRARRLVPGGIELVVDVSGPRPFRVRMAADGTDAVPTVGEDVRLEWPAAAAWWFDAGGRRVDG